MLQLYALYCIGAVLLICVMGKPIRSVECKNHDSPDALAFFGDVMFVRWLRGYFT